LRSDASLLVSSFAAAIRSLCNTWKGRHFGDAPVIAVDCPYSASATDQVDDQKRISIRGSQSSSSLIVLGHAEHRRPVHCSRANDRLRYRSCAKRQPPEAPRGCRCCSERQQWLFRLPRCFGRRRVLALAALDDLEHAHQAELVAMRTRSHRCPTMTGGGSRWAAEKNPGTNVNNGGSFASDYSREGCLAGGPLLFPGKPLTLEASCD
jgi:hypothetical protein